MKPAAIGVEAVLQFSRNLGGNVSGVELTDLVAERPGAGAGTTYMTALIAMATEEDISVSVSPSSGRNREFYERFGFEVEPSGYAMVRHPPLPEDMQWLLEQQR